MQSFISQLLYVAVGQTEQPLPTLPAGMGCATNWEVTSTIHKTCLFIVQHSVLKVHYLAEGGDIAYECILTVLVLYYKCTLWYVRYWTAIANVASSLVNVSYWFIYGHLDATFVIKNMQTKILAAVES